MHRDLDNEWRKLVEGSGQSWACELFGAGQSLALAREAWIAAFDKAAEELDAVEAKAQADRDYYENHVRPMGGGSQ